MQKFSLALPSMFGDHHVVEVRRILAAIPGVKEIYASSAFHVVEVDFEPEVVSPEIIQAALQEAGYMEVIPGPTEIHGDPANAEAERPFFRHTAAFPNVRTTISFTQEIPAVARPLWPCPGLNHEPLEKEVEHG